MMNFDELMASRAELEAAIRDQEEKIKDFEKHNEDQNAKIEATKHKLARTEVTIRALEAKVKLQKAHLDDLKEESQQQQDEIKALNTQERSDQLNYAAKISELKRNNAVQAAKIAALQKAKTCDVSGVKANFSFLQSKHTRAESEYKEKIADLNSKNLEQKVNMRDLIKELQTQKEDREAEIDTLKDHLKDKEDLISKLLDASQTEDSSWKAHAKSLEAKSLKKKYSAETFRCEKLQQQLKLNQYDVDQVHEIAQSLEFHFNSTYVRFSGDHKLHTKAELEEAYMEAQRLQDKRRASALARRMRIQEEEDRDRYAYSEEE
ncbi:hypothetical protein FACUT_7287 [Fusarium acutatum]|uniref:Uncharacterized protein n=1 Tax=Fusarium acutatum TaxID=78861 RepID=A0A8H4NJD9_9HYPO|nr:hypothetical protein FACUT_7287 [Fusarium acutatum]